MNTKRWLKRSIVLHTCNVVHSNGTINFTKATLQPYKSELRRSFVVMYRLRMFQQPNNNDRKSLHSSLCTDAMLRDSPFYTFATKPPTKIIA